MGGERASLAGLGCATSPVCAHDPAAGPNESWPCSSSSAPSLRRLSPSVPLLSSLAWLCLKKKLLLTRHKCFSGVWLFSEGAFVPLLPWDNGEVSGVSAFKADSSGCAVSVSKQGSSSVRYCKKRECGGGRNALVLRQVLCSLIARGAAFTGPMPACRQPSALNAGWAAVTGERPGHLQSKRLLGCRWHTWKAKAVKTLPKHGQRGGSQPSSPLSP